MKRFMTDGKHSKIHTRAAACKGYKPECCLAYSSFSLYCFSFIKYANKSGKKIYKNNVSNKNISFHSITGTIILRLHRFFNLFFKFRDYSLFETGYVGLRNAQSISHLLLGILAVTVHTKPHFHYLFLPRRQALYNV